MSLKSIEMQVALPRTQNAGKSLDHMQKQHQQFQDTLAQSQLKKEKLKQKQVQTSSKVRNPVTKDEEKQNPKDKQSSKKQHLKRLKQSFTKHPYLGNKIDLMK
ncbi:2-oxoglutarate dehydrogenase complex dehydrogenase (E1) component-like enzyme [Cerasibacillus quisquiliarum]|uniref:Uncharacterized protein n=1 Tax=Cerasibacillus quisquiliarum TaxID=227865 RepID=A0A511UV57_9BACI|nr:hypothetical protein [Cerasibacillus quisquiliarum]MBB5145883.1 2-oxoglutarate dehydrogenase complex dehydrogenase (E1) component-like enzyme [Cerasibacillus quisquiliarum]GEN30454.1 hypothetical protein CQU01_06920 [Cerasibacillus quisquiliarum]